MNRTVAGALFVVGLLLMAAGLRSSKSASSQLSEIFNNRPTQETTVLLAAGIGAMAAGVWGGLKGSGKP